MFSVTSLGSTLTTALTGYVLAAYTCLLLTVVGFIVCTTVQISTHNST